ncbi:MAG: hypothetical protein DRP50_08575 [Thermotoga sp.]|nr:MAG: hypothetical protein DRP50_08575 [Thermotoga sp.]
MFRNVEQVEVKTLADNSKEIIGSIVRAFKIIEFISSKGSATFKDIRQETNFPPSTLNRYLKTLKFVHAIKEIGNDKYVIGENLLTIKVDWLDSNETMKIISNEIKEVSEKTGETVHIAILSEDMKNIVYLQTILGSKALTMKTPIGKMAPSYCTALGKMLLASKPEELVREAFKDFEFVKYTKTTICTLDKLIDELREIKTRCYAVDNGESEEEVLCYAVPIENSKGETIAAMSISGFKVWMKQYNSEELLSIMNNARKRLKKKLIEI